MSRARLDLIGKKFGYLTVLAPEGTTERGASLWRCSCGLCGKECVKVGSDLTKKSKNRISCGCYNSIKGDMTGKTFGAITVLERTDMRSHKAAIYKVRCNICGKIDYKLSNAIRTNLKSCGCKAFDQDYAEKSRLGREAFIIDNINTKTVVQTQALKTSASGYRWVMWNAKTNAYQYEFVVRGERHRKFGFETAEAAYEQALSDHAIVLSKYGLEHRK